MAHWNAKDSAVQYFDQIITDIEDQGIGAGPPFTIYWNPARITRFCILKRWPWVERLAQLAQSRDAEDM
jgi:hypothetical protein